MTPENDFGALPLSPDLIAVTRELGYKTLTPIQAQTIPSLLKGHDLIGKSKTGSGKTAAFSLPILQNIRTEDRTVQALVLCPTRELCAQVAREIRKLGRRHAGLQVLILSGGHPIFPQLCALEKGVHIAVGTPGRVLDHLHRQTLDLTGVSTVILDEADRMLDMGFQEDMEAILQHVSLPRQVVFFSATFPDSIHHLSRRYQKSPVTVEIETPEAVGHSDIEQIIYETSPSTKEAALLSLLAEKKPESAIVFCNLKSTVSDLTRALKKSHLSVEGLSGDLEQNDRDRVLAKFRNRSCRILIATDVAARGLDVENLDLVINFDFPDKSDAYVHRIGRTGRAGKKGLAISFASPNENHRVKSVERLTQKTIPRVAFDPNKETKTFDPLSDLQAKMETLFISGGRKDKVRPGDILGALTGDAGGFNAQNVGKIEIHDRFSYVAVSKEVSQAALASLRNGQIKGRKFRIEFVR